MSFNKYLVPEPSKMISVLEGGVAAFFRRKIDAMIGNSDSMRMLDDAYDMMRLGMEETEIIKTLKENYKDVIGNEHNTVRV